MIEKLRATFEFEVNEDDVDGRWTRNGVEIQFSVEERFSYATIRRLHRLTISETYRSDAGEYSFSAGKNKSTMNLHVKRKNSELPSQSTCLYIRFMDMRLNPRVKVCVCVCVWSNTHYYV